MKQDVQIITVYYQIVISGEYLQLKLKILHIIARVPTLQLGSFLFRRRVLRVLVSGTTKPTHCAGAVAVGATTSKRRHVHDVDTRSQP